MRSVLLKNSVLFLLNNSDSPQLDQPLLLYLSLFLLFLLSILIQFDLPEPFNLSFVLLLLHSFLLSRKLLQLFLFSQPLKHSYSEMFLQVFLFLFLFLFHLSLLNCCLPQHIFELFFLSLLLFILLLKLFLLHELIILHSHLLQSFNLLLTLFLLGFQLEINCLLFFFFCNHLQLLPFISLIESALVLSYLFKLLPFGSHFLNSELIFEFILFNHNFIHFLFLLLFLLDPPHFLLSQSLNLPINHSFLLKILFSGFSFQILSVINLLLKNSQIFSFLFSNGPSFGFFSFSLFLSSFDHLCLFFRLSDSLLESACLFFCDLLSSLFGCV